MRIIAGALVLVVSSTSTSHADGGTRAAAVAAAEQMMEDAYLYMGVAYLCEDAIGSAHYHAARIAVEHAAKLGGKTDDDAVILVDDLVKRVKVDVPKKAPAENASKCIDSLLERQTAFRVSQARFKKAAAADR